MSLQKKLDQVPKAPGVYLFLNNVGTIIYIGKAKILRNRVRSYFQKQDNKDTKTQTLVKNVTNLEWIVVRDEVEAFLTEANLIKEHRPRYNIFLKDDKTFPYLQITHEPFPRILIIRMKNLKRDHHTYFGPYTDAKYLRETLKALHKIFPIRSCNYYIDNKAIAGGKYSICLGYHINRCQGACEGLVSQMEYTDMINQVVQFLKGRNDTVREYLFQKMEQMSTDLKFEEAGRLRDQLNAVEQFTKKQKKVSADFIDRDIITVAYENNYGVGTVMRVRNNLFIGREKFNLTINNSDSVSEVLTQFLRQYYSSTTDYPKEVLIPDDLSDKTDSEHWLTEMRGNRVNIIIPSRGEKKKLIAICQRNADLLLGEIRLRKAARKELLPKPILQLQEDLGLSVPPRRIEAFDNSNLQGTNPVASMVCFIDGKPRKSEYRRFKIKTVIGPDDFASMFEVVSRRYKRVLNEQKPLPDLILVDGGKGQLSFAKRALDDLKLNYIPIIGLAKKLEEVFIPGFSEPQNISKTSPGLYLLRNVRDEAHRVAISFHRAKRSKQMTKSILLDIPGIGERRVQTIRASYKSLTELRNSPPDEIYEKTKLPKKIIQKLIENLKN